MSSTTLAIVAIVAVAALALLLRRGASNDPAAAPRPDSDAPEPAREIDDEDDEDEEEDVMLEPGTDHPVPITSAGVAVVPSGAGVRLVSLQPQEDEEAAWFDESIGTGAVSSLRVESALSRARRLGAAVELLHPGDFTGARVRRDAEGGWRLETLGRDGEFGYMMFETEAAARTAVEMFEHAEVVRRPLDEDGRPVPPSAEDFEEARRRFEQTERELAIATDDDEPPPPNEWSSRR